VKFKCPNCEKSIIVQSNVVQGDTIIKSRLVFLNKDKNVLCKCNNCKKIISLPLSFRKSTIEEKTKIIDI